EVGTDTFTYAIRLGNGTLSWATAKVQIVGVNDAAVLSSDTKNLTETNAATDISAGGALTITDVDSSATFQAQTNVAGSYGHFSINAAGVWTYTADNAHNEFVGGQTYTDTFDVQSADGTHTSVTINILGTNDAAIISGTTTGSVIEAGGVANGTPGTPTASGTLTDTDVDNTANSFQAVAAGAAIISGTTIGSVTEAGGVANGTPGTPTAIGTLTDTDVDNAANSFQPVAAGTASTDGYGTYAMTAGGTWTYTLDNSNAAVQALNVGGTLTDHITVATADGTTQVVTITINGANDAPVAVADVNAGNEDSLITGTVATNDSDVDSAALVYSLN